MRNKSISHTELIAMLGALMAADALAIDIILPAFPDIGQVFGIADPNHIAVVLTAFMIGFGPFQLLMGPLSDRFGRRPLILAGVVGYVAMSLACMLAPSLLALLLARFVQGIAAAAIRVAMMASVRDRFSGQKMVDTMSIIGAVFLLVPIVCPSLGQVLLFTGSWRAIFLFMALFGLLLLVWVFRRFEETLAPQNRGVMDLADFAKAFRTVFAHREAFFYGLCAPFAFGIIANMLNTAQPIYVDVFGLGAWFPVAFAFTTIVASGANLLMPTITRRFGLRRTAHAGVLAMISVSIAYALLAEIYPPTLLSFYLMLVILFTGVVATFATTGTLSMMPLGEVAGTASAVFGAFTMGGGAVLGFLAAQTYDGSVVPVVWANAVIGCGALVCLLIAEKGKLFSCELHVLPVAGEAAQ